ncbi:MAG TPA: hypothetical protein VEX43_09940 [Chthoniobacterales bacterium]|nr:hypothetical protein [Chthoniobacterales bacterium]
MKAKDRVDKVYLGNYRSVTEYAVGIRIGVLEKVLGIARSLLKGWWLRFQPRHCWRWLANFASDLVKKGVGSNRQRVNRSHIKFDKPEKDCGVELALSGSLSGDSVHVPPCLAFLWLKLEGSHWIFSMGGGQT